MYFILQFVFGRAGSVGEIPRSRGHNGSRHVNCYTDTPESSVLMLIRRVVRDGVLIPQIPRDMLGDVVYFGERFRIKDFTAGSERQGIEIVFGHRCRFGGFTG